MDEGDDDAGVVVVVMASVPAEVGVCDVERSVLDDNDEVVEATDEDCGVFEELAIDDAAAADEAEAELADAPVPIGTFCRR